MRRGSRWWWVGERSHWKNPKRCRRETISVVETIRWDVEVEILGHPALVIGEFCYPVEFAVTSVGEAVGLADGGSVTDFCGHVLHVGDLGEVGYIGGVSDYRHCNGIGVGTRRKVGVNEGTEVKVVGISSKGAIAESGTGSSGLGSGSGGGDGLVGDAISSGVFAEIVTPSVGAEAIGGDSTGDRLNSSGSCGINAVESGFAVCGGEIERVASLVVGGDGKGRCVLLELPSLRRRYVHRHGIILRRHRNHRLHRQVHLRPRTLRHILRMCPLRHRRKQHRPQNPREHHPARPEQIILIELMYSHDLRLYSFFKPVTIGYNYTPIIPNHNHLVNTFYAYFPTSPAPPPISSPHAPPQNPPNVL